MNVFRLYFARNIRQFISNFDICAPFQISQTA